MTDTEPVVPRAPVTGAERLRADLASMGLGCDVEARGALALLLLGRGDDADTLARLARGGARESVVRAAKAHGFTHVALELREGDD